MSYILFAILMLVVVYLIVQQHLKNLDKTVDENSKLQTDLQLKDSDKTK